MALVVSWMTFGLLAASKTDSMKYVNMSLLSDPTLRIDSMGNLSGIRQGIPIYLAKVK